MHIKLIDLLESTGETGAYVLAIGVINIPTGKTEYGWSIYDNPNSDIYLASQYGGDGSHFLLYAADGTFTVGDSGILRHNDSKKKLKPFKIVDMSKANKENVIEMLYKHKYDYKPKRPFQKSAFSSGTSRYVGSPNKLSTSYSVKGTY